MAGTFDFLCRFLFWSLNVLLLGICTAEAEPVRGQSRELGIAFELDGDAQWCGPQVRVVLTASQDNAYQAESIAFLNMIGRIRAVIDKQCRPVEHIVFDGYVGQSLTFAAETSRRTRWRRFLVLDPLTRKPLCSAQVDPQCGRRVGAYVTVRHIMRGEGFAEVELTSLLESGSNWHLAWKARGVRGGVRLTHQSEVDRDLWEITAFADANLTRIKQICEARRATILPVPHPDYGPAVVSRSMRCQTRGQPTTLYTILVGSEGEWLYLFSLSAEGGQINTADIFAARLAKAIAEGPLPDAD